MADAAVTPANPASSSPDGEKSFLADIAGLYAQHAAMWSVYTESIKILVSVTSLPALAAALIISVSKDASIDFGKLPDLLVYTLLVLPFLNFFLLGVVIHNRLVILFYARAINGYRRIYLDSWNVGRDEEHRLSLPMPVDSKTPKNYEVKGPMGLIVHCCAVINGLFMGGALNTSYDRPTVICAGIITVVFYEAWYAINCRTAGPPNHSEGREGLNATPMASATQLAVLRSEARREALIHVASAAQELALAKAAAEAVTTAGAEQMASVRAESERVKQEADLAVTASQEKATREAAARQVAESKAIDMEVEARKTADDVNAMKVRIADYKRAFEANTLESTARLAELAARDAKIADLSKQLAAEQALVEKLKAQLPAEPPPSP